MAVLLSVLFCFNTQPPEGGWQAYLSCAYLHTCFNTQPPEGGWSTIAASDVDGTVSTHSRLKAAAPRTVRGVCFVCFNTQPPEGGWATARAWKRADKVSTHSRLKAAVLR